jgi:Ca2+-binding EF-hand superfamily protein
MSSNLHGETGNAEAAHVLDVIFENNDGWANWEKISHDAGGITKTEFEALCHKFWNSKVMRETIKDDLTHGIAKAIIDFTNHEDADMVAKVVSGIWDAAEESLTPLINTVFRFFDENGDGHISKEEFVTAVSAFSGNKHAFAVALYHMLDEDHNGQVEATEVSDFVNSIVASLCSLLNGMIDVFTPHIRDGFIKDFVIGLVDAMMPMSLPIDMIVAMAPMFAADPNVAQCIQMIMSACNAQATQNKPFFEVFDQQAGEEGLPIDKVVDLFVEMIHGPVLENMPKFNEALPMLIPAVMAAGPQAAMFAPMIQTAIDQCAQMPQIGERIDSQAKLLASGGTLKAVIKACFTLIDVDSNGTLTKQELHAIYDAAAKGDLSAFIRACLSIVDTTQDGIIGADDMPKLYTKVVDLVLALLKVFIKVFRFMVSAASLPVSTLAINMIPNNPTAYTAAPAVDMDNVETWLTMLG